MNRRAAPAKPEAIVFANRADVFGKLAPSVSTGARRAVFLYAPFRELHPFRDANGRVARIPLNRLLVEAWRFAHARCDGSDSEPVFRANTPGDAAVTSPHSPT
jgi:fido (protein-threonine AMPylation protein)